MPGVTNIEHAIEEGMEALPEFWMCGNCGWTGDRWSLLWDSCGCSHCPDCCSSETVSVGESELLEKYVADGGVHCPYCGDDVEGDSVEIDGKEATQEIHCVSCEKKWRDVYKLTSAEPIKED